MGSKFNAYGCVDVKTSNLKILQRNVLKCVPHVQHDYFSSPNQYNYGFLALSQQLTEVIIA